MTDHTDRWLLVGAAIEARMRELGMIKADLIRASGVSDKTLSGYLEGAPIIRRDKARDLCLALGWSTNSIDRILSGEEPIRAAELIREATDVINLRQRQVEDARERLASATGGKNEARALIDYQATVAALESARERHAELSELAGVERADAPRPVDFRSRYLESLRQQVHELIDEAEVADELIDVIKMVAWCRARRFHEDAYLREAEAVDEPWWDADYPPSLDAFFERTIQVAEAFEEAGIVWREALAAFEAEQTAREEAQRDLYFEQVDEVGDPDDHALAASEPGVDSSPAPTDESPRPRPPAVDPDDTA